ncbi:MAG: hypothetical protein AB7W37_12685 [Syntrophobacteraceae bacterium]
MSDQELKFKSLPPEVKRLADVVRSCSDSPVHLVGGGVRDMMLGRPPKDLDFLVFGPIDSLTRKVAKKLGRRAIHIGQAEKVLWRIVGEELEMDFTPPRDSTLEGDLKNRDFTINALAWSLNDDHIVDLVGGVKDLGARCIRMTHPLVFLQDPVRLMRAFRLAASLDFHVESKTLEQMTADKNLIQSAASERVGMEFMELLRTRASALHVRGMLRAGIVDGALSGDALGEADHEAWESSITALESLDAIAGDVERVFPYYGGEVRRWLMESRNTPILKLALLLFDVRRGAFLQAKPSPKAAAAGNRLALSNKEERLLAELLDGLPAVLHALQEPFYDAQAPGERSMLRLLRATAACTEGLLPLAIAIIASTEASDRLDCAIDRARKLLTLYCEVHRPRLREPRLLTGEDLKGMGLSPGPFFKEVLEAVEAARMEGETTDRAGALALVRQIMSQKRNTDCNERLS